MFGTKCTNSRRNLCNTAHLLPLACTIQHTFYLLPVQYTTPFTSCLCNTAHLLPLPCKYKLSLTNPENFQTNSAVQAISTNSTDHLPTFHICRTVDSNTSSSLPSRVTSLLFSSCFITYLLSL
jgi:hypothetical protein